MKNRQDLEAAIKLRPISLPDINQTNAMVLPLKSLESESARARGEKSSLFQIMPLRKQLTQMLWHGRRIGRSDLTFGMRSQQIERERAEFTVLRMHSDIAFIGWTELLALIGKQFLISWARGGLLEPNVLRHSRHLFSYCRIESLPR
jgi:hypothetical protein